MKRFTSIAEIRERNRQMGQFFFAPDTMRFWNSHIETDVLYGRFFITSEDNYDRSLRLYTIREAHDNGSINTIRSFQKYQSLQAAKDALDEHVEGLKIEADA